jgi:hypothetical protein
MSTRSYNNINIIILDIINSLVFYINMTYQARLVQFVPTEKSWSLSPDTSNICKFYKANTTQNTNDI